MKYLHTNKNFNHEITVFETNHLYGEKGKFRVLQFSNEAVQGALDLENPDRIVLEYPRAIIHLLKSNNPEFENVFVIGHGIGTIAGYFADKIFTIAELDPEVVELSRRFFDYQLDNVTVGDGRSILEGEDDEVYDYVVLDAFNSKGTPKHLISREFFTTITEKLNPQGSLIMNAIGKSENDTLINAIHTTLREVFPYLKSFALPAEGANDHQNILIMASHQPLKFQERLMAGFREIQGGDGYIITDNY
ncbi:spermidine synthase [Paenibacillus wynnii]|uniref:Spermidine synthase n=1 Tax=Paenibacillus wynnii TaxID=268407 RepID=A0A098M4L7_9BACL|nr:fused MFS/spermidine synthase [Paenibacillus wynnii]KGE16996.1 spermidine synthase [Paenibacillus wynnii]